MSMNITPQTSSNNSTSMAAGTVLGLVGMNAYFLPVTKERYIKNAFAVHKSIINSDIAKLDEAAIALAKRRLKTEQKLFLSQIGVPEKMDDIKIKITELINSITSPVEVKNAKQLFATSFKNVKKSEALRDNVSSRAFKRVKWTNLGWGAFIGFVLGNVLGAAAPSAPKVPPPQL